MVVAAMAVVVGVEVMVEDVGETDMEVEVVVVETDTEEVEETDMVVVEEVTDMGVEALVTGVVEQTLEEEMKKFSQKIRYLFKDYHRMLELRI